MTIFTRTKETKPAGRSLTDIDGDVLAWRSRHEQPGRDREDIKAREQDAVTRRGQLTAELVPDEKAVKAARSQHAAVFAEREEIELASPRSTSGATTWRPSARPGRTPATDHAALARSIVLA